MGCFGPLSANDHALIAEAVRRIQGARKGSADDHAAILSAVAAAWREGRRDLFGLVKAGRRPG